MAQGLSSLLPALFATLARCHEPTIDHNHRSTHHLTPRYYGRIGVDREAEDAHRQEIEAAVATSKRDIETGRVLPARLALEAVMTHLQANSTLGR